MTAPLVRSAPPAPVRIVHLGLGAFFRAHQAWYTAHATDAADWGIAAFTGRSPDAARVLAGQDGLYTLVERGAEQDRAEVVGSLVEAVDGADLRRLTALLADPSVAVVTLTITEAGYLLRDGGGPDLDDPALAEDLRRLRDGGAPTTAPGRLLLGLDARRRAGAGAVAVVPCDNVPANGPAVRRLLAEAAAAVSIDLVAWIEDEVRVVGTSVDRITPRTTDRDVAALQAATGRIDAAPVITEPFTDWVLSGAFPGGRPEWEAAGARFVDDVEPWERRKLWLLNGAHTLLAFAGPPRGRATVAQAIADPDLRRAVQRFWDEAVRHLPAGLDLDAYRAALLTRFENPRIEHRLAQIAQDGERKLRLRVLPVAEAEVSAGRSAEGCAFAVRAWLAEVPATERRARLAALSPLLAADERFAAAVGAAAG